MMVENGMFMVKGLVGDQVLYWICVVMCIVRQMFIGFMCFLYLFLVQFYVQIGCIRNGNFFVFNFQWILGQVIIVFLLNLVGIDSGRIIWCCCVYMGKYCQRDIEMVIRMVVLGQFLVVVKLCYMDCIGKCLEVWIGKWNIYCIEYYCMIYFVLVGGDYVSCDG